MFTGNYGADFGGAIYMESVGVELRDVLLDSNACAPVRGLGGGLASASWILETACTAVASLCARGLTARTTSRAVHTLQLLYAGVNAFLAASNVTACGNAGGFTGGGLHLQNTQHLLPGVPLSGITVINNTCAFAGGFAVFGGTPRAPLIRSGLAWHQAEHFVPCCPDSMQPLLLECRVQPDICKLQHPEQHVTIPRWGDHVHICNNVYPEQHHQQQQVRACTDPSGMLY